MGNHWLAFGHDNLIRWSGEVVFCRRVGGVPAELVGAVDQVKILFAKFAILAGVNGVPKELLSHDTDDGRFGLRWKLVGEFCPEGNGKANQENAFNEGDCDFDIAGSM